MFSRQMNDSIVKACTQDELEELRKPLYMGANNSLDQKRKERSFRDTQPL